MLSIKLSARFTHDVVAECIMPFLITHEWEHLDLEYTTIPNIHLREQRLTGSMVDGVWPDTPVKDCSNDQRRKVSVVPQIIKIGSLQHLPLFYSMCLGLGHPCCTHQQAYRLTRLSDAPVRRGSPSHSSTCAPQNSPSLCSFFLNHFNLFMHLSMHCTGTTLSVPNGTVRLTKWD